MGNIENDLGPPCMFYSLITNLEKKQKNLKFYLTYLSIDTEKMYAKFQKKKVLNFMKLGLFFQTKDLNFLK